MFQSNLSLIFLYVCDSLNFLSYSASWLINGSKISLYYLGSLYLKSTGAYNASTFVTFKSLIWAKGCSFQRSSNLLISWGAIFLDLLNSISVGCLNSQGSKALFSISGYQFSMSQLLSLTESWLTHGSLQSKIMKVSFFAETKPRRKTLRLEQL